MRLEHGSYGKKLLPDGKYLMEVKISGAVPLWFTKIISGLNVYPVSFSKYGTEYKQYVLTNYTSLMDKGENICLNTISISQSMLGILVAVVIGLVIAFVYTLVSKKDGYNKSFIIGLALLPAIVAAVILLVFVVLSVTGFGTRDAHRKQLRITIPENLNYMVVFDDIFDKYLSENVLRKVKTTNMGTMFELTYECRIKDESEQKQFIDELRVRNGNLNITMGMMPDSDGGYLN